MAKRIAIGDVLAATQLVFGSIAGILKADLNKMLTMAQINEIFDSMRATTRQLRDDYCGNGQTPSAKTDVANIVSSFGD